MAIVKKKNSKNYYIVIYKNGKHHWISSGTDDELTAKEKELRMLRTIQEHKTNDKIHKFIEKVTKETLPVIGVPVANAWNAYISEPEQKELAPRTLKSKKYDFVKFTDWMTKNYPEITHLHKISKDIAYEFAQGLIDSKVSGKTYNNVKVNLHSIFKVLRYKAELDINIWDYVPAISKKTESFRPFTDTEVSKVLEVTKNTEWYGACLLSLYTGLRFADVANMKWETIKTDNIIDIIPAKTARFNKRVIIPLHSVLMDYFSKLDRNNDYIFPKIARDYKSGHSEFAKYLKLAELDQDKNVTFHSFRHTFNSRLEHLNIDVGTRQKLTGHSTVDMNLIYSHALEPLKKAISQLPEIAQKKENPGTESGASK